MDLHVQFVGHEPAAPISPIAYVLRDDLAAVEKFGVCECVLAGSPTAARVAVYLGPQTSNTETLSAFIEATPAAQVSADEKWLVAEVERIDPRAYDNAHLGSVESALAELAVTERDELARALDLLREGLRGFDAQVAWNPNEYFGRVRALLDGRPALQLPAEAALTGSAFDAESIEQGDSL